MSLRPKKRHLLSSSPHLILTTFPGELNFNDLDPNHGVSSHSTCVTFGACFHGRTVVMVVMVVTVMMRTMMVVTVMMRTMMVVTVMGTTMVVVGGVRMVMMTYKVQGHQQQ